MKKIICLAATLLLISTVAFCSSGDQFYVINDFSKGQNSHTSIFNTPDKQAYEDTNVRVNSSYSALSKRDALIQDIDWGSTAINSLHRFYKSDATMKTIVTTSTLVRADFSGTATTIDDGLTDSKRWQWITYQDKSIGGNDTDLPIKYDGKTDITANTDGHRTATEVCAELGAPFAELDNASGGNDLDAASWYQYKIAWYDGTTYSYSTARSNPILTGIAGTVIDTGEAAWDTEQGANVVCTADAVVYKVGAKSAKFVVSDLGANALLATQDISSTDMTGYTYIHFWTYCDETQTAGDLRIGVSEEADMGEGGSYAWVDIPALALNTWERHSVAITTTGINAAISIGIEQVTDEDGFTLYIDDVSMSALPLVHNIALTDVPLGPSGTTYRYIYRTLGHTTQANAEASSTYYNVGSIADNSTQTYADSMHDDDADDDGAPTWATASGGTNATPPICPYWEIINERAFAGGNTTYYSRLYWSDEYNPDYFDPIDYEDIRPDDGDKITFIKTLLGVPIIGKTNTIQKFYVSAASDADWYASDPFSYVGCPAPYSAANTPLGIFYLSWFGIYNFNAQSSQLISDAVTDEIADISRTNIATTTGHYHEGEYHLSFISTASGSAVNDREAIYNLTRDAYVIDTKNINCYASFNSGTDTGILYMGSSTTDGWTTKYTVGASSLIVRTKADIDAGTHSDSMAFGTDDDPTVSMIAIDRMNTYANDTLAQVAWVSSDSTETYPSTTKTLLHFDGDFDDEGATDHTWTASGATINTNIKKFGSGSGYFDGANDVLQGPSAHADFDYGTGDFTIEAQIYVTSFATNRCFVSVGPDDGGGNSAGWHFQILSGGTQLDWRHTTAGGGWTQTLTNDYAFALNTWYHVAAVRSSNVLTMYVNGTALDTTLSLAGISVDSSAETAVGDYARHDPSDIHAWFAGYIDEVRLSKGLAVWTADFVAPTHEYGSYLQTYSEGDTVNEGDYSLEVAAVKTNSLNDTVSKTITALDLSAATHDDILVDVYAARSGTQFQFGMGESGGAFTDNLVNVPVTAANTWETVTLDFSGVADASKDAVIYVGVKITNADAENIIFIDNIRPSLTSAIWTSKTYYIGASGGSLDKLYWNEVLGIYGGVTFQIRLDSDSDLTGIAWNTAVTNPSGSDISGVTALDYMEIRANFSSSNGEYAPYLFQADGFVAKTIYSAVGTAYESSVGSVWQSGWKDFGVQGHKKFIKRIKVFYHGTSGILTFGLENEEGDIDQEFDIDLSIAANDADFYTGVGSSKIYTWTPPENSETNPSPIGQFFNFQISEDGVTVWDIDRVEIMYQIEELY